MKPVQTSYPISVINLNLSSSPNVGIPSRYYRWIYIEIYVQRKCKGKDFSVATPFRFM